MQCKTSSFIKMRVNYASAKDKFKIEVGDLHSNFRQLRHEGPQVSQNIIIEWHYQGAACPICSFFLNL